MNNDDPIHRQIGVLYVLQFFLSTLKNDKGGRSKGLNGYRIMSL